MKDKVKTNWYKASYLGGLTMEGKGNKYESKQEIKVQEMQTRRIVRVFG